VGRRSITGGVRAKGSDRIQFDFEYNGVRYRPTLARTPTEGNLRRARQQLEDIKARIAHGTFRFAEEFPDFRDIDKLGEAAGRRTCSEVFDEFVSHTQSRVDRNDLAFATLEGYRKILDSVWRPAIGAMYFDEVRYSTLVRIADGRPGIKKKTHNNIVSAVRCAFEYGYRDHPERPNPAAALKCFRLAKKDRPPVDPFSIQEAETIIAAIHHDWGEAQGNYDEFRFFTGLRPSEQIALQMNDCDVGQGKILISKARVMRRDKDRTKTGEDRIVELCPRAQEVLKRQLALRARMKLAGKIRHEDVFFREDGSPIRNLNDPYDCWRWTLRRLKARYREPYNARHSSVSWNLMIGKNLLWVAKQHGHSVTTMLDVYAAWTEGATDSDVEAIKRAMESSPHSPVRTIAAKAPPPAGPQPPEFGTGLALEESGRKVSRGFRREIYGGKGGTRTLDPGIMSAVL
jgi:integrase